MFQVMWTAEPVALLFRLAGQNNSHKRGILRIEVEIFPPHTLATESQKGQDSKRFPGLGSACMLSWASTLLSEIETNLIE